MATEFDPKNYHPVIHPIFPAQDTPMGHLIKDLEERIIMFRADSITATTPEMEARYRAKADTLNYVRAEIILALEETELASSESSWLVGDFPEYVI